MSVGHLIQHLSLIENFHNYMMYCYQLLHRVKLSLEDKFIANPVPNFSSGVAMRFAIQQT